MRHIKKIYRCLKSNNNIFKIRKDKRYRNNIVAGELIRNIHSIEKGLCIKNPRIGFGQKKINAMFKQIEILENSSSTYHIETIRMAEDVLNEYYKFSKEVNYSGDIIKKIKEFLEENNYKENEKKYGGTIEIDRDDIKCNVKEIEKFFLTRHSVRDFEKNKTDTQKIIKALQLAQRAPSACNRQGVRVYILEKEKINDMSDWLEGTGGFSNDIDKFIIITAKLSSYREEEDYQYIVSSSMYAAYVSLTLHLYGMGACIIQRPVIFTKKWKILRKKWNIDGDEQIICILGVGNLKEKFKVPISHRLENNEMIRII